MQSFKLELLLDETRRRRFARAYPPKSALFPDIRPRRAELGSLVRLLSPALLVTIA